MTHVRANIFVKLKGEESQDKWYRLIDYTTNSFIIDLDNGKRFASFPERISDIRLERKAEENPDHK